MPAFKKTIEVSAIRVTKAAHIIHDSGSLRVKEGYWLIQGPEYGPNYYMTDEEFLSEFTQVGDVGPEDERLRRALDTGHL